MRAANLNMQAISIFYSARIKTVFHFNRTVAKRSVLYFVYIISSA